MDSSIPILIHMKNLSETKMNRRFFLGTSVAACVAGPALALTQSQATRLVDNLVAEINRVIGSGKSESGMIRDFEKIFTRYADVDTIARSALGPQARGASASELANYTKAFRGYIARKYGKRFREFVGGDITVQNTINRGKFYEVESSVNLRGSSPFTVAFRVSDRSGKDLFFDIIIEGASLLSSERVEIGALLDRRGGDISRLARDLANIG